jgi:hypothetical protein
LLRSRTHPTHSVLLFRKGDKFFCRVASFAEQKAALFGMLPMVGLLATLANPPYAFSVAF